MNKTVYGNTMANGRNLHLDDLATSPKKLQHAKPNVSLTMKNSGSRKRKDPAGSSILDHANDRRCGVLKVIKYQDDIKLEYVYIYIASIYVTDTDSFYNWWCYW